MNFFNIFSSSKKEEKHQNNDFVIIAENTNNSVRLSLFTELCRDISPTKFDFLINNYFNLITNTNKKEMLCDLFIIMFYYRDYRKGKGEKQLFYSMFLRAYEKYSDITSHIIYSVPDYGSWKDIWQLVTMTPDTLLRSHLYSACVYQLNKDKQQLYDKNYNQISLCAKWCPNEKSELYNKIPDFKAFLIMLFPNSKTLEKDYRKLIVELRKQTNVSEQNMCSNQYDKIDPDKTPLVCASKNSNAFLNMKKDNIEPYSYYVGNRCLLNQNRIICRQKWLKHKALIIKNQLSIDEQNCSYDEMRHILDDEYYQPIKEIVSKYSNHV